MCCLRERVAGMLFCVGESRMGWANTFDVAMSTAVYFVRVCSATAVVEPRARNK
jgi:hypothetical protein